MRLNIVGIIMKKKSSPNFENAVMVAGQIFGTAHYDISKTITELEVDGHRTPFVECASDVLVDYHSETQVNFDYRDLGKSLSLASGVDKPQEVFSAAVNSLPEWVLERQNTLQIKIKRQGSPCHIDIDRTLSVVQFDEPLAFVVFIAAHRADAILHLTFKNSTNEEITNVSVSFNQTCFGGKKKSGYQYVKTPLPKGVRQCDIQMSVEYLAYTGLQGENPPFLFIAGAHVEPVRENLKARLAEPRVFIASSGKTDGTLMRAYLPNSLEPGASVSLVIGKEKLQLFNGPQVNIFVGENYGHSLVLKSDQTLSCLLYIDGDCAARIELLKGDTIVRIPTRYLDGTCHYISLRDITGSISFLELSQDVPCILTPVDVMQRESSAPFPNTVMAQTSRRYASLKQQLTNATTQTNMPQLSYALSVLEGGYDNVKLKPLHFPQVKNPEVSIIIPAHNKIEVTYLALCSLLVSYNKISFEVIVVDDASTDETRKLETFVSGIKVIHNKEPQRFIRACNAGAKEASGEYIVLLNNDVEVTSGWLDELRAGFDRFDNVGLTGAKLLYPNGRLQDAGGVVWKSGNPLNYGHNQNPNDPRFSYARQADYLTGAAMMVSKTIWKELGGLSSYLEPMYFEDTDFAFKAREAGYTTWFIPSAEVYHFEGLTSGTDTSSGFKKFQEVNRPKFIRRWANAFKNFGAQGYKVDLEKDRGIVGRVLFIDYNVPRPDQDAGSYAAVEEIRLVQSLGYKVTFMPTNLAHLGKYTEELQKMGVEMIYAPFFRSAAEYLSKHASDFDVCYITRYYVAKQVLGKIRAAAPKMKIIFNNADLHFLREIRVAKSENDPDKMIRSRQTREEELEVIKHADIVFSYSDVEHSVIQAYTEGEATVMKCPWVVDIPADIPDLSKRSGMSFIGGFRHYPNAEGIKWFCKTVLPLTKGVSLSIYGSAMSDDIENLRSETINPVGFVQDLSDAYNRHRIFVAPLLSGAGIKGKVLSALAHGIPCILTETAAEGIGLRHGHDCLIVKTPEEWVSAIESLMKDDALWLNISQNASVYMKNSFSFEEGRKKMRAAFEAIELYQSYV